MNEHSLLRKVKIRHIGLRSVAFALAVLVIAAGIAVFVGARVRGITKENLILRGELNAKEAAMEYNRYLRIRMDIVTMVGNSVDDLLESGADNSEIEKYLTDETENIISTLDPGTTGLYGWFNGAYVDGAGWVPDDDFVATERPWYIETLRSGREITFVDPYLDAHTHTVMMTVSKLLSDGESILAMDVNLGPIQQIISLTAADTEGGQAFLLDANGVIVAHSDESLLGKNCFDDPEGLGGIVARRLILEGQRRFEADTPEGGYSVYADRLEGDWYSVSVIDRDVWFRPLQRAMLVFFVILALVLLSIVAVFLWVTAKNAVLEELHTKVDREEKRGEALQALSETDRMTGLNDRVSGERKVTELLAAGSAGMFLEFDIDRFKNINDSCGHQAGDLAIIAVADALRKSFRANDVTIRLGGDEFGVFAVGIVDRQMGEAIVRRLFERLEAIELPEAPDIRIHASAGAVLRREGDGQGFRELYARADEALYLSKKTPGSCLTFHED